MKSRSIILFVALVSLCCDLHAQFKYYKKGHDSYTSGNYEDAVSNFSEYLTKPTRDKALDVEVYYLRALSYYKSNRFANAVDDFEEAVLNDHPNKGNIYWFLAKSYAETNNLPEAQAAYSNAIRLLDSNKDSKTKLFFERSQLYLKMGDVPKAYADLKSIAWMDSSNQEVQRELARLEKQNPSLRSTAVVGTATSAQQGGTPGPAMDQPPAGNNAQPTNTQPANTQPIVTQSVPVVAAASTIADFYKDEKRYALVIGNADYPKEIGALRNPVNDATDFAKELQNSNFEVQLLTNATYGQIRAAMLRFKEKVDASERDKTVALFYYAGHGLQGEDENYLVPIDAKIEYEDDIVRYCFPVQKMVLANMERSNSRMNIVVLDACRNNPFPSVTRSLGGDGLGEMRRARGTFVAYATAPGSVASDGTGRNGLYTQELIKAMRKPGLTIEQVFKDVRANVLRLSGDRQNTWDSSNIIGEFYFKF
jgi:tetratricopeptide (TPR) repeat protein